MIDSVLELGGAPPVTRSALASLTPPGTLSMRQGFVLMMHSMRPGGGFPVTVGTAYRGAEEGRTAIAARSCAPPPAAPLPACYIGLAWKRKVLDLIANQRFPIAF